MTEATTEVSTLIRNALYSHYGVVQIAVDEEYFVGIADSTGMKTAPNSRSELLEGPGTQGWVDRMVRLRTSLLTDLANARAEVQQLNTRWENVGEALLQQAIDRDWCAEYDAFAEEWGFPTRVAEYDVTMTVRVSARSEEAALEIVQEGVNINSYTEGLVEGPEFSADVS